MELYKEILSKALEQERIEIIIQTFEELGSNGGNRHDE